jgi:TRAP-type mannitol/chloroaromatic compound transport system permease large subunit
LATPTEAGAMGAVGAIVLAVLHSPKFSRFGKFAALLGGGMLTVLAIPAVISWLPSIFSAAAAKSAKTIVDTIHTPLFGVFYAAVVVLLWEAVRISELRGLIKQAFETTMRISAMVMFILIGATVFSLVFQGVDGGKWIEHMLSGLPGGVVGFLIFVNIFIFLLAFFLDFFEIAFVVVPLLAPVAQKLLTGYVGAEHALIWFGVLVCVNVQTSFMHPPFGFALFYLRGIAPASVKSSDIYWGAVPWVFLQLILVVVVIFWPESITYWLDAGPTVDPSKIKIDIPSMDTQTPPPPPDFK